MKIERLTIDLPSPATREAIGLLNEVVTRRYDPEAPPADCDAVLLLAQKRSITYYGILENQEVLAAAECEQVERDDVPATAIWNMGTRPDQQGRGLGTLLLLHIAQTAMERGDTLLELDSQADQFYAGFGFTRLNPDEMTMRASPAEVLMIGARKQK